MQKLQMAKAAICSKAVVLLLLIRYWLLLPLWDYVIVQCLVFYFYFEIVSIGERGLNALLSFSSWCLVIVMWLFLAMPWICLQFVMIIRTTFCGQFVK